MSFPVCRPPLQAHVGRRAVAHRRVKRLVFRVPHCKTDRALREEWQAKRAAGTLPVMPGAPQAVPRD